MSSTHDTHFDGSNVPRPDVQPGRGAPCPAVSDALAQCRTASAEQQYQRDLEVIARCEEQIEREAGCPDFFGCMGRLAAGRAHG